jgi:GTPase SAR1 family protein
MGDKGRSSLRKSTSISQRTPKYFYQFRFIIIGDSTVGKSSLIRQFTEGNFVDTTPADPTVGVDFHVRVVEVSGEYIYPSCRIL